MEESRGGCRTNAGGCVSLNLFGSIPRSLWPKGYSQTSKSPLFPKASIGNPDETVTGPPDKKVRG
jgi:hypothetical protein